MTMTTTEAKTSMISVSTLEKLASGIRNSHEHIKHAQPRSSTWVEGMITLATYLHQARQHFRSAMALGHWMKEHGRCDFYHSRDRRALIIMGANPPAMREALYISRSRTPHIILSASEARFNSPNTNLQTTKLLPRPPTKVITTRRSKTPTDLKLVMRKEKLGATYSRIKGSSLDHPKELMALITLGEAPGDVRTGRAPGFDPTLVEALVAKAEKGEAVSAVNMLVENKRRPPATVENLIDVWMHCRILPVWLRADYETRCQFIDHLMTHHLKDTV